jgi:DNA repair exonuclease SbcCD ATPase subunit
MDNSFIVRAHPAEVPEIGEVPEFDNWSGELLERWREGEQRRAKFHKDLFDDNDSYSSAEEERRYRQELWETFTGYYSEDTVEELQAQVDNLAEELEETRASLLKEQLKRQEQAGHTAELYEMVQRLEARLAQHEAPRVCRCRALCYDVICAKCGEKLN